MNNIPSFKESNLRKSMESSIKKFGVPVPIMSKDVRDAFEASMLDKYGVKNAFLLKTFQEKAEKTQQEKFGTKRWIQSEYAFKRTYGSFLRKYYYNGIYFDSSWELAFYVYFNDKGVPIKRESTRYEYIHKGKVHSYFPDFKLPCCEVEIKGSHLIDKDGKWICPYGNDDGTSEAKHQCAIDNGVIIITSKKIKFFINYVKDKYGNKFFKTYMLHKGIGATDVEK